MNLSTEEAIIVISYLHKHMAYKVLRNKYPYTMFRYKHCSWTARELMQLWLTEGTFDIQKVEPKDGNYVELQHIRNLINSMDEQRIQQILLHDKLGIPQEPQWKSH